MGPFIAMTALWGYPYLVRSEGVAPGTARLWLLVCVAAFGVSAPALGALAGRGEGRRDGLILGCCLALAVAWAATLLWPGGHAPPPVIVATLVVTGIAGACGMLAFDVARAGNPAESAGAASGLANTGGFSAAVVVQLAAAALLSAGDVSIGLALLPMLGLVVLGCARLVRTRSVRVPLARKAAVRLS